MRRFLSWLLFFYVTVVALWFIGRSFSGDRAFPVLVLNNFGVWVFSPIILFLPYTLHTKNKYQIISLILPIALFLWFYGNLLLPTGNGPSGVRGTFTVLSHNIKDSTIDTDEFSWILDCHSPNIVVLQEFTRSNRFLEQLLNVRYSYRSLDLFTGLAVYSQYPISEEYVTHSIATPFQAVTLDVDGEMINVINAHLAHPGFLLFLETFNWTLIRDLSQLRVNQIYAINSLIAELGQNTIVACDCNFTDLSSTYDLMTNELNDAFRERGVGLGHTFLIPRGLEISSNLNVPFQRIDYIFYGPQFEVLHIEVLSDSAQSDHLPLWASFYIKD